MGVYEPDREQEDAIRTAARAGRLPELIAGSPALRATLYMIVSVLVYEQLTRPIERNRGHRRCAVSIDNLEPDCHDRHQDDVSAVQSDLLRNATKPIENLEGWMVPRLKPVTIDAHRRRRGERGALQRPRLPLPRWLAAEIGDDRWLETLAIEILTWVGVPVSAGVAVWPLSTWVEKRAAMTGRCDHTEAEILRDVERVLKAMRTNCLWYEKFVERPLGRKRAPVLPMQHTDRDGSREPSYLELTDRDDMDDAHLHELAFEAITAIRLRVERGEDPQTVIMEVLHMVFDAQAGADEMDRAPGTGAGEDEQVSALLADPVTVDRVVATVREILLGGLANSGQSVGARGPGVTGVAAA